MPPALSVVETWLAQVKLDLAFTAGATYNYTIAEVNRDVKPPSAINKYPSVNMDFEGKDTDGEFSSQEYHTIGRLTLFTYVKKSREDTAMDTVMSALQRDLDIAMCGPTTNRHPASGSNTCVHTSPAGEDRFDVDGYDMLCLASRYQVMLDHTWSAP